MIRRFSSHEARSNGNEVDNKNGERKVERDSPEMNSNGSEVSSVFKVGDLIEVDICNLEDDKGRRKLLFICQAHLLFHHFFFLLKPTSVNKMVNVQDLRFEVWCWFQVKHNVLFTLVMLSLVAT